LAHASLVLHEPQGMTETVKIVVERTVQSGTWLRLRLGAKLETHLRCW